MSKVTGDKEFVSCVKTLQIKKLSRNLKTCSLSCLRIYAFDFICKFWGQRGKTRHKCTYIFSNKFPAAASPSRIYWIQWPWKIWILLHIFLLSALHHPLIFRLSNYLHFAKTSSFLSPLFFTKCLHFLFFSPPWKTTKLVRVKVVNLKCYLYISVGVVSCRWGQKTCSYNIWFITSVLLCIVVCKNQRRVFGRCCSGKVLSAR